MILKELKINNKCINGICIKTKAAHKKLILHATLYRKSITNFYYIISLHIYLLKQYRKHMQ